MTFSLKAVSRFKQLEPAEEGSLFSLSLIILHYKSFVHFFSPQLIPHFVLISHSFIFQAFFHCNIRRLLSSAPSFSPQGIKGRPAVICKDDNATVLNKQTLPVHIYLYIGCKPFWMYIQVRNKSDHPLKGWLDTVCLTSLIQYFN